MEVLGALVQQQGGERARGASVRRHCWRDRSDGLHCVQPEFPTDYRNGTIRCSEQAATSAKRTLVVLSQGRVLLSCSGYIIAGLPLLFTGCI